MKASLKTYYLLLLLLALTGLGCATTNDSENLSSRPWNSPRGWEYGMPGMMPQYGR